MEEHKTLNNLFILIVSNGNWLPLTFEVSLRLLYILEEVTNGEHSTNVFYENITINTTY